MSNAMERRVVRVTVRAWDESFDCPLSEFVAEIRGLFESVPDEHRPSLIINFDRRGSDYDYSAGEMSLYYERPETDEEISTRIEAAEQSKKNKEARERAMFAELRAKYGDGL